MTTTDKQIDTLRAELRAANRALDDERGRREKAEGERDDAEQHIANFGKLLADMGFEPGDEKPADFVRAQIGAHADCRDQRLHIANLEARIRALQAAANGRNR